MSDMTDTLTWVARAEEDVAPCAEPWGFDV